MLSETLAKGASHNAIAERLRALHLKKKMGRVEFYNSTRNQLRPGPCLNRPAPSGLLERDERKSARTNIPPQNA